MPGNFFKKLIILFFVGMIFCGFLFFYDKKQKENKEQKITEEKEIERTNLNFGFITDVHCYGKNDKKTNQWELNWRCKQPLDNFVNLMNNEFRPDFVIENGDMADGRDKQEELNFVRAKEIFDKLDSLHYHVLGNHETRGFLKNRWLELTGYDKPYYFFDVREYRIIVLDGNNKMDIDGQEIDTSPEKRSYPGYIDKEQMAWLENLLKESENYEKIVFIHQPPVESTTIKPPSLLFSNGEQIRKMFSRYKILAVFAGHIEEMCSLEYDNVKYYVLKGVHKDNRQLPEEHQYKDQGIFYEVAINKKNGIEIKMFRKEKEDKDYQTLIVNEKTSVCNNASALKPEEYQKIIIQPENEEE